MLPLRALQALTAAAMTTLVTSVAKAETDQTAVTASGEESPTLLRNVKEFRYVSGFVSKPDGSIAPISGSYWTGEEIAVLGASCTHTEQRLRSVNVVTFASLRILVPTLAIKSTAIDCVAGLSKGSGWTRSPLRANQPARVAQSDGAAP